MKHGYKNDKTGADMSIIPMCDFYRINMLFLTGNACCTVFQSVLVLSLLYRNSVLTSKYCVLKPLLMFKKVSLAVQFTVETILNKNQHVCCVPYCQLQNQTQSLFMEISGVNGNINS